MVSNLSGMLYRQYIKERSAMTTSKKEFNASLKKAKDWDGKSRVSNDTYRESWNRIFGGKTEKKEKKTEDRGKGVTICKAKDCNNSLYGWTSSKNKEYCVDCV